MAYRVSNSQNNNPLLSQRTFSSHQTNENENENSGGGDSRLVEGFNDGGEEGSGSKLLHLL